MSEPRPPKSQMDIHQIFKHSFDDVTGALRTIPSIESAFELSLNSEDDSIMAERRQLIISGTDPISCVGISSICLYSASSATLEVSPEDSGDEWYELISGSTGISAVKAICARRVRIVGTGKAVGQG